jgi:hypothetical protein
MDRYRIEPYGYALAVMTLAMTVVAVLVFLAGPGGPAAIAWSTILVVFWHGTLLSPHEVRILPDRRLELRRLIGSRFVPIQDVRSLRALGPGLGFVLRHERGRVWFRVPLTETAHFATRLRIWKPGIEVTGL